MLVNDDAQLAAVVHPKVRFDWVDSDQQKFVLTEKLKMKIQNSVLSPTLTMLKQMSSRAMC
jgi:hypothetical protein